jgi:hypothetical protein
VKVLMYLLRRSDRDGVFQLARIVLRHIVLETKRKMIRSGTRSERGQKMSMLTWDESNNSSEHSSRTQHAAEQSV